MSRLVAWARALSAIVLGAVAMPAEIPALEVVKRAEETITRVKNTNNGANPLWCFGSHIFVRDGERIYLSLLDKDEGYRPYCNGHWELWQRDGEGWNQRFAGGAGLDREPSPIGLLAPGQLVLSIQPKFVPKPEDDGKGDLPWFCQPGLLGIRPEADDRDDVYTHFHPVFPPGSIFSQHSYRGMAIDRENGEVLLAIIEQTDEHYQPTWMDRSGRWTPLPLLKFPVRSCYPQVILKDREAHILAIGDIKEPVPAWAALKREVLQREWDYVFRRLFYTWSPDLAREPFRPPLEIDSVEATGGNMRNLDLFRADDGTVYILYLKQPHQYAFIRDRYFPGQAMTTSLELAVVRAGRVVRRSTLAKAFQNGEGSNSPGSVLTAFGRFHPLPDGSLGVVFSGFPGGPKAGGEAAFFLGRLGDQGALLDQVRLDVERPPVYPFFTNTPRSGSDIGTFLDIISAHPDGDIYEMVYLGFEIQD